MLSGRRARRPHRGDPRGHAARPPCRSWPTCSACCPRSGLDEADVPGPALDHLAQGCYRAGALVEVNEKWACPSPRTIRALAAAGVPLVASTDSHDCATVGRYARVREILAAVPADPGALMGVVADVFDWVLVLFVWSAPCPCWPPPTSSCSSTVHSAATTTENASRIFPRTAVLVPAWNEAAVIGASIDRLMQLEYPPDSLRVFVVDDASTDDTPEVVQGQGGPVPGPGRPPAPGEGRPGQGAHAQPRAADHPRATTGCRRC